MEFEEKPNEIILVTNDQMKFSIDIKFKDLSELIQNILEDSSADEEIPIDLESTILKKILEYSAMHFFNPPEIEKPIKSSDLKKNLCNLDYNFIKNYNYETVKPLILAATYLNIKNLRDLCICLIATEFYFEPTQDGIDNVRKKFSLTEEITPDIEQELKNEYPWAFKEKDQFIELQLKEKFKNQEKKSE